MHDDSVAAMSVRPAMAIRVERGRGQSINDDCIEKGSPKGLIGSMSVTVARGGVNNPEKMGLSSMDGPRGRGRLLDGQLN